MKFKVGDKVKVVGGEDAESTSIEPYLGRILTIKAFDTTVEETEYEYVSEFEEIDNGLFGGIYLKHLELANAVAVENVEVIKGLQTKLNETNLAIETKKAELKKLNSDHLAYQKAAHSKITRLKIAIEELAEQLSNK